MEFCDENETGGLPDDSRVSDEQKPVAGDVPAAAARQAIDPNDADDTDSAPLAVAALLRKMRDGDRSAAAEFVTRYGPVIRRRIGGKLSPPMRRLFDSQDILSTLGRRLDLFVRSGSVEATSEAELWALVYRMAENAVVDKARVFRHLQEVEDEDGPFARDLLRRLHSAQDRTTDGADVEIGTVLEFIKDQIDRQILHLWLLGTHHSVIAESVELAPTAVRKRWQQIKTRLRKHFAVDLGT